ncbi:MAG TPA: asparagine synthase (glutamine-hydrolyzing) [Nitrospirales bacterium]|nr:asparagine synthase (glutamine-hydrolyzing) [Nitrospirales bacterium]
MCGIAGVIGPVDRTTAEGAVRRMLAVLARRGPDGEGIETWNDAVLGHRRLAIFDVSDAGRQPMVSPNRSVGVVFNGAIYNFKELRAQLLARGFSFRSNTDTEVLIHGYCEWGIDRLVGKLRGMFAFGLWDGTAKILYLVRDRLGVKPLVFCAANGSVAFASTVRALRAAGYAGEVDDAAVADVVKLGFVSDARSIYRGIVKVPAATIVECSGGEVKSRPYWVPAGTGPSASCSFQEAVEETERRLLDAVAVRLQADVPVAALLSGGVDSSLICWAVTRLGADITAYTIGTPGDRWDESAAARWTAARIGIRHRVVSMSDMELPDATELVSAYAEPFACASALGMLRVAREMSSSAKVLLTGDGGDDVFLGYPRHRYLRMAEWLGESSPKTLTKAWGIARTHVPRVGPIRRAAALLDYASGGLDAYLAHAHESQLGPVQHIFGERLRELVELAGATTSAPVPSRSLLADYLDYERRTYFVGEYMTKVDGATMHYGLEARSPFLDQELWEFAEALPVGLRLRHGRLKAVLRALAGTRIGRQVAGRPKHGFGIPVQRWMVGRWRSHIEAMLRDSLLAREGWIDAKALLNLLRIAAGHGSASAVVWHLCVLELWCRHERVAYA